MTAKLNRKAELENFLKGPRNRVGLRRCQTCKLDDETLAALKSYAESNSEQTYSDFHVFMVEVFNYPMGPSALSSHIKNCLKSTKRR
jgi:hypothetical protein